MGGQKTFINIRDLDQVVTTKHCLNAVGMRESLIAGTYPYNVV